MCQSQNATMSCRTNRRTNRPSDSDYEVDRHCLPRHHYNTRSSVHNLRARESSPRSRYQQNHYEDEKDSSSMDCYSDQCLSNPPMRCKPTTSWFRRLSQIIYVLSLGTVVILVYTQVIVSQELQELKEEMYKIRGHKKEDPHTKLSKELDKKCSDTLKLLLKDPVNRPDFALESSGGRIITTEATPFTKPTKLLGFTICDGPHGPTSMIQATTSPGECWAFKGRAGKAVVELIDDVMVDSVTLEHIPPAISPSGKIDSAPKDFKIWGLDAPRGNRRLLGQFRYENDSSTVQSFNIDNNSGYYKFVEFEVLTNHGNDDFTCVYRLRVHGSSKKSLVK